MKETDLLCCHSCLLLFVIPDRKLRLFTAEKKYVASSVLLYANNNRIQKYFIITNLCHLGLRYTNDFVPICAHEVDLMIRLNCQCESSLDQTSLFLIQVNQCNFLKIYENTFKMVWPESLYCTPSGEVLASCCHLINSEFKNGPDKKSEKIPDIKL